MLLRFKVFLLNIFRKLNFADSKIWYKSEIDLSKAEAKILRKKIGWR